MAERRKIAALITAYYPRSHADVVVSKLLDGIPTDDGVMEPEVEIASMYLDQRHERDIGVAKAETHGVPMFESIPAALTLGGKELAVDGVLIIGEHGDYAWNEKEQHLYPRKFFFEQACGVMATSGRAVPVFSDKHLSYNWADASWIYERAKALDVPLMAGSSVPLAWRRPWLEYEKDTPVDTALSITYGPLDSYGFHGLELVQCMVERRAGGETGIESVQCLEGEAVWQAAESGLWDRDLAEQAAELITPREAGAFEDHCENPALFLMRYRSGLQTATLLLNGYTKGWAFGARRGDIVDAMEVTLPDDPHAHFSYLTLNIQRLFITGTPQYPVERTLLISGALEALLDSRHRGHIEIATPHLDVAYSSYDEMPIRPRGELPSGPATPKNPR